jgi:hypothetical protein
MFAYPLRVCVSVGGPAGGCVCVNVCEYVACMCVGGRICGWVHVCECVCVFCVHVCRWAAL